MLNKRIEVALNDQVHHEFANAFSYLAIASWFSEKNLPGFAHWMLVQYGEELGHARKLVDFILDRGGKLILQTLGKPAAEYKTAQDVFALTLKLEQGTTKKVNDLFALAGAEGDFATQSHLQWYVDEQVEEEKNAAEILAKLEMAGDSKGTLLMLDHQLGKRGKS